MSAVVMKPRFPPRGVSSFCEWCGRLVCRHGLAGPTYVRRGAGVLETVEVAAAFPVRVCRSDGTSEVIKTRDCWACSDECERKLLALNGLDPDLAGFVGEEPDPEADPDIIIGDVGPAFSRRPS